MTSSAEPWGPRDQPESPRGPPTNEVPTAPPPLLTRLGELSTGLELLRLMGAASRLWSAPRGDGAPVVCIPGYRAHDVSLAPLRAFLRRLGYDAEGWGLGTNVADPRDSVARLTPLVRRRAELAERPVHLVGWSLGGVVARELARAAPDAVASVTTMGSPVIGGPIHTVVGRGYDEVTRARILQDIESANRTRIQAPITVIFSRRDGIVDWRACLDRVEPRAHHIEVRSTHLGLGIDPDVWMAVARALAERS